MTTFKLVCLDHYRKHRWDHVHNVCQRCLKAKPVKPVTKVERWEIMDFENTIRAILKKHDEFSNIESDILSHGIDTLKVENARLRKALENIACGDIPIGNQLQHIPLTRWYEDYADAVLHEVK
jgi:hypothetical protein